MRVIVTRPAAQAASWVQALQQHGIAATALPLIGIAPPLDTAAVTSAWQRLADVRCTMFVSANAVEHFFALRPPGIDWPAGTQAASPGPGTTRALQEAGIALSQIVEPAPDSAQFDSEALWQRLRAQDWRGATVCVVRGDGGRDWLADTWREHGATVRFVAAYRRSAPTWDAAALSVLSAALAQPDEHLWFFSSSESIDHLIDRLSGAGSTLPPRARALATHPRIARRARQAGFATVDACLPTLAAVVACIQSSTP